MDNREHKVIDKCQRQHRFQRFLKFFEEVDRQLTPELGAHRVMDSYGTDKTPKVKR